MPETLLVPFFGHSVVGTKWIGHKIGYMVAKTYNRMILNRIRPEIDKKLRINQNGFRPGRTTTMKV